MTNPQTSHNARRRRKSISARHAGKRGEIRPRRGKVAPFDPMVGNLNLGGGSNLGSAGSSRPSGQPIPSKGPSEGFSLSRRHLIIGAAGVGTLAALGGGGAFLLSQQDSGEDFSVLSVPESAVTSSNDLGDAASTDDHMQLVGSYDLTYGSLLWATGDEVAACLLPGDTADPLCQIGILSLSSGSVNTVLENAVGNSEGYQIFDVRANSNGLVWVEADILEDSWRVYSANFSADGSIESPTLAEEGGGDWETPSIAVAGSRAFWQVMPKADSDSSSEPSVLRAVSFGGTSVSDVYTSYGRFASPPYGSSDSLTITPRLDTSGVYYQLTCLDAESDEVLDSMILPRSMSPLEAGYGLTGFMFSFDAIYSYGDGIANLGTYAPAQDARQSDYSQASWFHFSRTPTAAPAWCGNYLMVKSTTVVCGVDLSSNTWFSLGSVNGADDYGDYLASTGTGQRIVTYSNIDYTSLTGTTEKCCRVRVWQPVSETDS